MELKGKTPELRTRGQKTLTVEDRYAEISVTAQRHGTRLLIGNQNRTEPLPRRKNKRPTKDTLFLPTTKPWKNGVKARDYI